MLLLLRSVNPSKLTGGLWFKAGGTEEGSCLLIQSSVCNLPFAYTKHAGSQADQQVINQLTSFFSSYCRIPKICFNSSFSHSSAFSLSFSFLLFNHHRFARLLLCFTPLRSVLAMEREGQQERPTDRQTVGRERDSASPRQHLGRPHPRGSASLTKNTSAL